MKFTNYLLLLTFSLLLLTGCDDGFLVQTNGNELNKELFWKDKSDAQKGIIATYSQLQADNRWAWFENHYIAQNYRSDLIRATRKDLPFAQKIAGFTFTSDNKSFSDLWQDYYNGIFYANQVIENVPQIPEMSDSDKKHFLAEAKFLRGYYYLNLVTLFKNIPLVTSVPQNSDEYYAEQASPEKVWDQIIADFEEAKSTLPASYSAADKGRATKWAAQGYLGKAYMFLHEFDKADDEFKNIIDNGGFSLMSNFTDNFNGNGENGPESLFEIQHSSKRPNGFTESTPLYNEQAPGIMGGWEEFFPSDWLFSRMMEDTTASGELSDRAMGTVFFDHPNSTADGIAYADIKSDLGSEKRFYKKYLYSNDISDGNTTRSGMNVHLMRYADILLLYAEALNELGQTQQAIPYVNQVRQRSESADLSNSMSQSQLRTHLRHVERPVEFAMEFGIRWFDLARWNKGNLSIKDVLTNHGKPDAANFEEGKHELYPIPLSEINKNAKLEQNSGY
ncbi:RagB/SusD family nutrient uptake outer membrane protein [Fodinibius saliphilus]|uniref:RagB/SusD family nutrient uptake outer membrane protein n=1 Tax=Fodinibius saliphilus TaxID=1920650 RepID=UPI0011086B16|nr:RagB/SusD family nutrient uptake outer membrane protein [Fodinibius saliphilus]